MQRETEAKEGQRSGRNPGSCAPSGVGAAARRSRELPLDLALMPLRRGASGVCVVGGTDPSCLSVENE